MKIGKSINAVAVLAVVMVVGCHTPEPPNEWYKKLPNPATLKINEVLY